MLTFLLGQHINDKPKRIKIAVSETLLLPLRLSTGSQPHLKAHESLDQTPPV